MPARIPKKRTFRVAKPKAKSRRMPVPKKQIRTPKNPVKIIFLCGSGFKVSNDAMEMFLKLVQNKKLFLPITRGIVWDQPTIQQIRDADLIVSFVDFKYYKNYEQYHGAQGIERQTRMDEAIINLRKFGSKKILFPGDVIEEISIPEIILREIRKRFILRDSM